jgi:hypothetical protein
MPNPNVGENEKDFVSRCIPVVLKDGTAKDNTQATAICYSMYKEAQKKVSESFKQNIHETLSLSEGQIIPDIDGKRSNRAWWPLLRVGKGNGVSKNFYTQKAVESAAPLAISRKKMFFAHNEGEVRHVERDPRDWAASVKDTKIEGGTLYGLVQAYDPWLKDRMYDAPDEMACSIEGRGKPSGKKVIDGEEWNLVEEVRWINAFNIVDYPGNTGIGITLAESDKDEAEEETLETVAELKEKYSSIYEDVIKEGKEAAKAELQKTIDDKDSEIKALKEGKSMEDKSLKEMSEEILKLKNKIDAMEVLGLEEKKRSSIADMMKVLPKEAITDTFKSLVESAKDVETAKMLVDDRAKLFEGRVLGHGKTEDAAKPEEALKEREKNFMEALGIKTEEKK